jgi:hypothetical protein
MEQAPSRFYNLPRALPRKLRITTTFASGLGIACALDGRRCVWVYHEQSAWMKRTAEVSSVNPPTRRSIRAKATERPDHCLLLPS